MVKRNAFLRVKITILAVLDYTEIFENLKVFLDSQLVYI